MRPGESSGDSIRATFLWLVVVALAVVVYAWLGGWLE